MYILHVLQSAVKRRSSQTLTPHEFSHDNSKQKYLWFSGGWFRMSQLIGRGAHGFLCAVTPIGLPIAHRQVTAVVLLDSEAKRLFMATQEMECDPAHVEEPTTEVNTQENDQKEEAKIIAEEMQKRDLSKVYVSNLSNYMTQKELAVFLNEHHVEGVKWVFRVFGDA